MLDQILMESQVGDRELVIARQFVAQRAILFQAWTDPVQAMRWWGPRHCPAVLLEMDVRPGGRWRGCLKSPESGLERWQSGVFRDVSPSERLAFTFGWDGPEGRGPETLVTIDFLERDGGTLMNFRQGVFNTTPNRDGHHAGWSSSFDRLDDLLAALAG